MNPYCDIPYWLQEYAEDPQFHDLNAFSQWYAFYAPYLFGVLYAQ